MAGQGWGELETSPAVASLEQELMAPRRENRVPDPGQGEGVVGWGVGRALETARSPHHDCSSPS